MDARLGPMNAAQIALARLDALPGALPLWLGPSSGADGFGSSDPSVDLAYRAALETARSVGQRSLEEFLR